MGFGFLSNKAQIALPFILLVSGIIVELAIAGSFIAYFLSTSGLGERLALRAEAAAHAGIQDGMIKVASNKEFASTPVNYVLNVDGDSVAVSISRTINSQANLYIYTITATATAGSRQKRFIATVSVDQTTGQLQFQSIVEASVS
jgi:uncharacterized protein (UPF0333 family)